MSIEKNRAFLFIPHFLCIYRFDFFFLLCFTLVFYTFISLLLMLIFCLLLKNPQDLSYKEKHWHEACFLCNKCRVSLVDKQFGSKAEKIYCGNCYDSQFASRCDGCGEVFRAGTYNSMQLTSFYKYFLSFCIVSTSYLFCCCRCFYCAIHSVSCVFILRCFRVVDLYSFPVKRETQAVYRMFAL